MHLDGFSGDRLSLHDASNFGMVALFHRQLAEFKRRRRKRLSLSGKCRYFDRDRQQCG